MSIEARVTAALDQGWDLYGNGSVLVNELNESVVKAVDRILKLDSPPNRMMLLTIAAGTAQNPLSNPASIQLAAGVDRRGQAKIPIRVIGKFIADKGLNLKLSKDPGVSNQWREEVIDSAWVRGRRGQAAVWAEAFKEIVDWLNAAPAGVERADRAQQLLEYVCYALVELASGNVLNYPKFMVTPKLATKLAEEFLRSAPNGPDALEAVVTAAVRALIRYMDPGGTVVRGDTNSPDAIDILITSGDGATTTGIEVTDEPISLAKLQLEVLPAMQKHGLMTASVVSRGVATGDADEIGRWLEVVFVKFGQRIDLLTPEDIEKWLSLPGLSEDIATGFVWEVGPELDALSSDGNRREWHSVLTDYIDEISRIQDSQD